MITDRCLCLCLSLCVCMCVCVCTCMCMCMCVFVAFSMGEEEPALQQDAAAQQSRVSLLAAPLSLLRCTWCPSALCAFQGLAGQVSAVALATAVSMTAA